MSVANLGSIDKREHSDAPLLVERFLLEQAELTAVERFSQQHQLLEVPARAKYYRDLIPLSRPGPGEQYAFRVDLDACSGCKACVAACHELNGLEDEETWREVGLIVSADADVPAMQHVTTACHHCIDPACLSGCPVRAYEKDPLTGIVQHLDDQCIGCQYCIWTCPYEVPKFSAQKGIVRKCDMCRQRLAVDEAPACVQSCPNQAISIELIRTDDVRARALEHDFLPSAPAPDPQITSPTTRYVTRRTGTSLTQSADHQIDEPQHAHWPLVMMLILTQLGVSLLVIERLLSFSLAIVGERSLHTALQLPIVLCATLVPAVGLGLANLHLGRPHLAFRAVLGWRTSWLSREVIAMAALLMISALYSGALYNADRWGVPHWLLETIGYAASAIGLTAVATSVMVYVATRRATWSAWTVIHQFGISIILLGSTSGLVALTLSQVGVSSRSSAVVLILERALLASVLVFTFVRMLSALAGTRQSMLPEGISFQTTVEKRRIRLLTGPLGHLLRLSISLTILSSCVAAALLSTDFLATAGFGTTRGAFPHLLLLIAAAGLRLGSEVLEKYLFFVTALTRKMPGAMP